VRIQLAGGVSWHAEVADNDKSGAENDDLVEHVRQLVGERRRDGPRRSVDTDNDRKVKRAHNTHIIKCSCALKLHSS